MNKNYSSIKSYKHRMIVSRSLFGTLCLCVISYMLLTVLTVSLVNERKDIRDDIRDAQVAISDLEVNYFELTKSIDQSVISKFGFTQKTVPVFAYTHPENETVALLR